MARLLLIDDDRDALQFATGVLELEYDVTTCLSGDEGISLASSRSFDLVLTDLGMAPTDGFAVIAALTRLTPAPEVVVLTATDRAAATLEALRLGARDYVVKPATAETLLKAVSRALNRCRGARDGALYGLVGGSIALSQVRDLIPLLSRSRETVLVMGETGTGKELFVRALHENGPRAAGPFVAHNVAATPTDLAESIFFGHCRGAFSGAHADHAGLFERAHGGTLFLDELDSLQPALQAKLLRTLECRSVQRVGAVAERAVDVRLVVASASDPAEMVARGAFRADLYYRVRGVEVVMPPLRERMEDLVELVEHILGEYSRELARPFRLSPDAEALLLAHDWPGNVRELRQTLRAAATLAESGTILPRHLPRVLQPHAPEQGSSGGRLVDLQLGAIRRMLERTCGNQSLAAQLLGIDRGTLARKLKRSAQ